MLVTQKAPQPHDECVDTMRSHCEAPCEHDQRARVHDCASRRLTRIRGSISIVEQHLDRRAPVEEQPRRRSRRQHAGCHGRQTASHLPAALFASATNFRHAAISSRE